MSQIKEIRLKDFFPTFPYPPSFKVPENTLAEYIKKPLNVNYRIVEKKAFINYPTLFGKSFRNVWFSGEALLELTDYDLYCLELLFVDDDEERNLFEMFPSSEIYVYSLNRPFKTHPIAGGKIGVT